MQLDSDLVDHQKPLAAKGDDIDVNGDYEVDEPTSRELFCNFILGTDTRFGNPMLNVRAELPEETTSPAHLAKIDITVSAKWDFNAFLMFLIAISLGTLVASIVVLVGIVSSTGCLLYTSPSPRDVEESRMPSSA